jgi:hypothetical protein
MGRSYAVKFGSNFEPFVPKREVRHGDHTGMTRELMSDVRMPEVRCQTSDV